MKTEIVSNVCLPQKGQKGEHVQDLIENLLKQLTSLVPVSLVGASVDSVSEAIFNLE